MYYFFEENSLPYSIYRLKKYIGTQTYVEWVMIMVTQISLIGMIIELNDQRRGFFFEKPTLYNIELLFLAVSSTGKVTPLLLLSSEDDLMMD